MAVQITVVGLGQIGVSIGLALAEHKAHVRRVGIDREPSRMQRAQKMGAFDQVFHNLNQAVKDADLVLLCVPVDEIEQNLKYISADLRAGAVVVNTTPVRVTFEKSAPRLLADERYFISMTPVLAAKYLDETEVGAQAAHADLFQKTVMLITSPPNTHNDALKLVSDLVGLLGGYPLFADPYEAEGLLAATQILPELAAAAMVKATLDEPGWREARKVASRAYAEVTSPLLNLNENTVLGKTALLTRENSLRVLDNLVAALLDLRSLIEAQDQDGLSALMQRLQEARIMWAAERQEGAWDLPSTDSAPRPGDMFGRLFGIRPRTKDRS